MSDKRDMICIVCPIGCQLEVETDTKSNTGYLITGNKCKRGEKYAIDEINNPTRVVTTTVKIEKAHLKRLPVRTNGAIPKSMIFDCMKIVNNVVVEAPIKAGDVIVKDILEVGVDLIASRSM